MAFTAPIPAFNPKPFIPACLRWIHDLRVSGPMFVGRIGGFPDWDLASIVEMLGKYIDACRKNLSGKLDVAPTDWSARTKSSFPTHQKAQWQDRTNRLSLAPRFQTPKYFRLQCWILLLECSRCTGGRGSNMDQTSNGKNGSGFSHWLRTGRLPTALSPEGVELKFNPWHDPEDGRFTFAGAGSHYGSSGADRADGPSARVSPRIDRAPSMGHRSMSHAARPSKSKALRRPVERRRSGVQPRSHAGSRPDAPPNPVAEFVGGFAEELYDVGKETVTGVHAALTTNPATTLRNAGRGIAGMIDTAIAAEDTPARIQVSRAVEAVANASARDIGRAAGAVAGNVALAVAPGAALSKASALRSLHLARPRTTYAPPQIGWVKETLKRDELWTAYNDAATGARSGQAPTLMRTMPDGSKRPVKFDGIQGEYVIDRKWGIRDAPHARAQVLRQSQVLAEHRLIGI